ncbi:MAG: GNAT family N-acetyltransferase [Theionarchaea archaeon]|nr:GNAT family N-acetyltransferase [Theionarchaea archaeon]
MKKNYLSFEHSLFAEVDGEIAGVIMGLDWRTRQQERMRTGLLKFRYFGGPFWLKVPYLLVNPYVPGIIGEGEYYIGHLVVYPQFRGMGLGKKLIAKEEDIARKRGAQRMVADVKVINEVMIKLVKEMGYTVSGDVKEMVIGRDRFHFYRITKDLRN